MYFRLFVCVCLLAPRISGSLTPASLQSSLSSLISPNLCQLKLICAISKSENNQLRQSVFMRGISTLADLTAGTFLGNLTTDAFLLQYSIEAGQTGRPCSLVAPQCPYSERELLAATEELGITRDHGDNHVSEIRSRWRRQTRGQDSPYDYSNYYNEQDNYYKDQNHYYNEHHEDGHYQREPQRHSRPGQSLRQPRPSPNRRQSVLGSMPPIFRPRDAMSREVCRGCDMRGNVCSVYGIGSFIGCTGILLIGGAPAQVACNMVTTPGSIGCGINTLSCFMESCGLIRMSLP